MVDVKTRDPSDAALTEITAALRTEGVLEGALVLSDIPRVGEWFDGTPARTALRARQLWELLPSSDSEALAANHFLFDHGNVLTARDVALARGISMEVVPSVNIFHYDGEEGVEHTVGAGRDITMLWGAGVRRFQIDSVYESICREAAGAADEEGAKL